MLVARPSVTPCGSSRQVCAAAAAPRARWRQQTRALNLQPGLCDVPTAAETPHTGCASILETHTPPSSPTADDCDVAHSGKAAAGQQHTAAPAWTAEAARNRVMAAVRPELVLLLLAAGAAVLLLGVICAGELEQQPAGRVPLASAMRSLKAACTERIKQSAARPQRIRSQQADRLSRPGACSSRASGRRPGLHTPAGWRCCCCGQVLDEATARPPGQRHVSTSWSAHCGRCQEAGRGSRSGATQVACTRQAALAPKAWIAVTRTHAFPAAGPEDCVRPRPAATGRCSCLRGGCMAADCKAGRMGRPVAATAGLQGGVAGVLRRVQRCRDSTDAARACLHTARVWPGVSTATALVPAQPQRPAAFHVAAVLQEAMTESGPYAWAYDASGIAVGDLLPHFSGEAGTAFETGEDSWQVPAPTSHACCAGTRGPLQACCFQAVSQVLTWACACRSASVDRSMHRCGGVCGGRHVSGQQQRSWQRGAAGAGSRTDWQVHLQLGGCQRDRWVRVLAYTSFGL